MKHLLLLWLFVPASFACEGVWSSVDLDWAELSELSERDSNYNPEAIITILKQAQEESTKFEVFRINGLVAGFYGLKMDSDDEDFMVLTELVISPELGRNDREMFAIEVKRRFDTALEHFDSLGIMATCDPDDKRCAHELKEAGFELFVAQKNRKGKPLDIYFYERRLR